MNLFSDENRRNPYPVYAQMRDHSPVLRVPPPFDAWMLLRYDDVKRALTDHETFSSRVPAPPWFIFLDPPIHTKLRNLVSRAFTPRMIAGLEPRIREISRGLLDSIGSRREMDLATEYAVPLATQIIAGMMGIQPEDSARFKSWSDTIMTLSYSRSGGGEAQRALADFTTVTAEMNSCLAEMIEQRRGSGHDDLLTDLIAAEVDGQRLSQQEILGFFQLLIVAGQETTANLIDNAMLCFMDHPDQLAGLRKSPEWMPSAIEEVLRFRSPLQWAMRTPRRDIEMRGHKIEAGKLVLCMIGSANRDSQAFADPDSFSIRREPNPHIALGHGIHFCLGAALSRLEARIALTDLLTRFSHFELAEAPWEPRRALNVLGPASLPLRFEIASGT